MSKRCNGCSHMPECWNKSWTEGINYCLRDDEYIGLGVRKTMKLINNSTYEDCLTIGKEYEVFCETDKNGDTMYILKDDNNEFLQTMVNRFEEVKTEDSI